MWFHLNPAERQRTFLEHYHRPPPWFDVVSGEPFEALAYGLSSRLRPQAPTSNLDRLLDAAWYRMPGRRDDDAGLYYGHTEPLSSAAPRLGIPLDGAAHLYRTDFRDEHGQPFTILIRTRDLVEFEALLWHDESWLIDENARWILAGMHDYPAYLWMLPAP